MRRIIAASIVLGLALGGVAQAGSDEARQRSASRADPQSLPEALKAALGAELPRVSWSGDCRTLGCINRRLNILKNAVNRAQADVNALASCMDVQGMTSFGEDPNGGTYGYVWWDGADEFLTTALDYDTLDAADIWAVVWIC